MADNGTRFPTVDELALELGAEMFSRMEAEQRADVACRVAIEAMKLLDASQMAELRHRLDALEVGDSDGDKGS